LNQTKEDRVTLYVAEEQQIQREAYQSFFLTHPGLDLAGLSGDTTGESLAKATAALQPDVVLLGTKILQPSTVEKLEYIREGCPDVALVLLSTYYDVRGIKALREFSKGTSAGCAYLLKHTIDTVEQLTQVIFSVAQGRIIVDPTVMDGLMASTESKSTLLKELSSREVEVLSWMAKGYRNGAIAEVLCLEPKTVERHINNIYSKLSCSVESKHPRVHAITLFLKTQGALLSEDICEDQSGGW
jgi:DNA-binding NarL/FixJ family response regulator